MVLWEKRKNKKSSLALNLSPKHLQSQMFLFWALSNSGLILFSKVHLQINSSTFFGLNCQHHEYDPSQEYLNHGDILLIYKVKKYTMFPTVYKLLKKKECYLATHEQTINYLDHTIMYKFDVSLLLNFLLCNMFISRVKKTKSWHKIAMLP